MTAGRFLFLVKIFSPAAFAGQSVCGLPYPSAPTVPYRLPTIGIPSFFLALEPNNSRVEGHFQQCFSRLPPRRLTNLVLVPAWSFYLCFCLPLDQLYTISAITVLFVGL